MDDRGSNPLRAPIYLPTALAEQLASEGIVQIIDGRPVLTWASGGPTPDGIIMIVGAVASVVTIAESATLRDLAGRILSWLRTAPTLDPASERDSWTLWVSGRRGRVHVDLVGEPTTDSILAAIDAAFGRDPEVALVGYDESYKLAFEEAQRAIDVQLDKLDSIHTRMGQLFSAAALSGGLLIGIALGGHRADHLTTVGLIAFVVAAVSFAWLCGTLVYVWNFTKGNFSLDADTIIFDYIEADAPKSTAQIHRQLARWMNRHRLQNGPAIDKRKGAFQRATIAFGIELVALGVALWDVLR